MATAASPIADRFWTQAEAIALSRQIEMLCPDHGCHVALTGGTLYKLGPRKDADFLFYRIRQVPAIDVDGLFAALDQIGITKHDDFGWCVKACYAGKSIDCFFPERDGDEYPAADPDDVGLEIF